MSDRETGLLRLKGQLNEDIAELARLELTNHCAQERIDTGAIDELDWAALGYTIHNIYCLMENYFLRIATFFENQLDEDTWHRSLVERMTTEVPGIRPRFMDRETGNSIDELRAFRHVFRNRYQGALDAERLALLQSRVLGLLGEFRNAHFKFVRALDLMAGRPQEPENA